MAIRESLLNTITSVASSDFVRLVTSAGESSKATVANLFKSFESGLSAKSSLTTSDYIRVVGSDNNLYKQSVSSVKSDMGVSALETEVDTLNSTLTAIKKTTTAVNLRPNSDVSGTVVIVIPADTYVFTNKVSNAVYHILYMNGSNTYVGYAYTSNFANF